jgi:septation ring formation regulator EzrA
MLDAISNFFTNGLNTMTISGGFSISFVILITVFIIFIITKFIKAMLPTIVEYLEKKKDKKASTEIDHLAAAYCRMMDLTNDFAGKYILRKEVEKSVQEIKRELEEVNKKLKKLQEVQSVLTKQQEKNKKDINDLKNNPDV